MAMRVIVEHAMLVVGLVAALHWRAPRHAEVDVVLLVKRIEEAQARDLFLRAVTAHRIVPEIHLACREVRLEVLLALAELEAGEIAVDVHAPAIDVPLVPLAELQIEAELRQRARQIRVPREARLILIWRQRAALVKAAQRIAVADVRMPLPVLVDLVCRINGNLDHVRARRAFLARAVLLVLEEMVVTDTDITADGELVGKFRCLLEPCAFLCREAISACCLAALDALHLAVIERVNLVQQGELLHIVVVGFLEFLRGRFLLGRHRAFVADGLLHNHRHLEAAQHAALRNGHVVVGHDACRNQAVCRLVRPVIRWHFREEVRSGFGRRRAAEHHRCHAHRENRLAALVPLFHCSEYLQNLIVSKS